MLTRIIVGLWIVGFLTSIGVDILTDKKPPTYTSYQVVSKAQEYSYYKSSATQVNILIVKNLETGKLEEKNVTVETHFSSNVGDTTQFEDNEGFKPWKSLLYVLFSILICILGYSAINLALVMYWVFTGKRLQIC